MSLLEGHPEGPLSVPEELGIDTLQRKEALFLDFVNSILVSLLVLVVISMVLRLCHVYLLCRIY